LTGRDKAGGGPGLTAAEGAELNRLVQRALGNRKYVEYDLHYRLETTEDVTTKLHVFGGRLSAELPAIHRFLDVIPQQTRRGDSQFRVKPVRAYLSVDYVSGIDKTALGADTSAKHVWRAELQAAWSTHLFNEFVLRAVWSGEYLIDAPAPVKAANREFNAFTQVWMTYPLSGKTGVLIKYVSGRLPPNYELATGGSMGLSISLQ